MVLFGKRQGDPHIRESGLGETYANTLAVAVLSGREDIARAFQDHVPGYSRLLPSMRPMFTAHIQNSPKLAPLKRHFVAVATDVICEMPMDGEGQWNIKALEAALRALSPVAVPKREDAPPQVQVVEDPTQDGPSLRDDDEAEAPTLKPGRRR